MWNPGDGNDIVEGQAGTDTLLFNGANVEREHQHLGQRRPGAVHPRRRQRHRWTSTTSRRIEFHALGGADNIVVGDLCGTDVDAGQPRPVGASGSGQGDGAADTVTVNGTQGADADRRRQQRRLGGRRSASRRR